MERREILKRLAMLPVAASLMPMGRIVYASDKGSETNELQGVSGGFSSSGSLLSDSNIFRSIGVEPLINCYGTYTIIGGSLERPAVRAAMEAASRNFIQYDELADAIGKRLAELTGAEWGMVSAGCAAGLKHVTAACVTGGDPEKLIRIPDLSGFLKNEVIIPHYARTSYDHAIRNIGVRIINVYTPAELESSISSRTAMIYVSPFSKESATGQPLSIETISQIAKSKGIPVLVDAAPDNLTIPSVYLKRGATIVAYSGGKALCGPQCAGLLLGDKKILMSAWQASSPHHGPGRDNKVGREEMIGLLAAVEDWTKRDHEAEWKRWLLWLDLISKKVLKIEGVRTRVYEPEELDNKSPVLHIIWDPEKLNITGDEVRIELGMSKPRIALGSLSEPDGNTSVNITTGQMQPGEETIVAERVFEILSHKRTPKSSKMAPPSSNLAGKWDITMIFSSSICQHSFSIEQDENWIQGTHSSDFEVRDMAGTIEGNQIMLRSYIPIIGDDITYVFAGTVSGDKMEGEVIMGEYRNAKFTAGRVMSKKIHQKVMMPGGPVTQ